MDKRSTNALKGNVTTQVIMPQSMYRELKREASSNGMSYSAYIKHLILITRATA